MHTESTDSNNGNILPGEFGIWIFVLMDMCIFALYFWVFAWGKNANPEIYADGQATLNLFFGGLNTVVLLVSSYFMASAVNSARQQNHENFRLNIKLTIAGGLIFLIVKIFEYHEKLNEGFNIVSDEFFRNYFSFTGFHLLHVVFGLGFLAYLLFGINNGEAYKTRISQIEGVGLYWHMVDLLWVVLFTLIYLTP